MKNIKKFAKSLVAPIFIGVVAGIIIGLWVGAIFYFREIERQQVEEIKETIKEQREFIERTYLGKVIPSEIKEATQQEPVIIEELLLEPVFQAKERFVYWGHHFPNTHRLIDTIIIHSTYYALGENVHSFEGVIRQYKMYGVANHYLIARDGTIYRLVLHQAIAYHAGISIMPDGTRKNIINHFSIGLGLIYHRDEYPAEIQYQSLVRLINYLQQQYNIPFEKILGHNVIAPNRKDDPWNFDWQYFYALIK